MNVRTLCLGILCHQEASGYEIKKAVEDGLFSHFIDASFGSIYPALTQMLANGLVTVRSEEQDGKPDKKVYAITEAGHEALAASLKVMPQRDKYKSEFLFQALFMDKLPGVHLRDVIDAHLAYLREELANVRDCQSEAHDDPGKTFVSGYGYAVISAAIAYMEEKKHVLLGAKARHSEAAE